MEKRFEEVDKKIDDIKVQLENSTAVTRNGRLRRMHQSINLIKVLKPNGLNSFEWTSHPQVPKHMKNTFFLGQRAKGVFEPGWEGKSKQESMYLMGPRYFIKMPSVTFWHLYPLFFFLFLLIFFYFYGKCFCTLSSMYELQFISMTSPANVLFNRSTCPAESPRYD